MKQIKGGIAFCITFLIVGVVLAVLSALIAEDSFQSGVLAGLSTVLILASFIRLFQLRKLLKNPAKAAEWLAYQKEERTIFIVNRARSVTFYISIFAELTASLVCAFALDQRLLSQVFSYLACAQCVLYLILFKIYSKRY